MSRLAISALSLLALCTLAATPTLSGPHHEPAADFELEVITTESSIEVHASEGCEFEFVTYSATNAADRTVWLTSSGIHGSRPATSLATASPFLFRIDFADQTIRAYSVSGCDWTKLNWTYGGDETCRAILSERGVQVLGSAANK